MTIPVVFSTDHGYIMPTGVAILSMLECSKDVFCDIIILTSADVTEDDKHSLQEIVEPYNAKISFSRMGNEFVGAFEIRGITEACYYRLLIPWLVPQYDKIVYCDGDIAFVQSISKLYSQELGNNYVAGKKPYLYNKKSFANYAPKLGLLPSEYINSGILVINAKLMRQHQLNKCFMEEAQKEYTFQDQDIINVVCKGRIATLPPEFNVGIYPPQFQRLSISMQERNHGTTIPTTGRHGGVYIASRRSSMLA